jgi:hypothetical protein
MEQTAMGWFIEQLPIRMQNYLQKNIEMAKQMEREQIEEAYELGWINGDLKKAPSLGKDHYEDKYSHPDPSDDEIYNNFNHEGGIKYDN